MVGDKLLVEYTTKTILELRNLQENGHLNLQPGFQRKSVWTLRDRRKLIQSISEGLPVPSIFLYRREQNGTPIYDVLDGKQRLETVFMFSRVRPFTKQWFDAKLKFQEDDDVDWWNWKSLEGYERTGRFLTYKFQVAEVSGEFGDIVELFVRINSTGRALTSSEKRHAQFYSSPLLKQAEKLAKRHRRYLVQQRIVSGTSIERMKDVELVTELLVSIEAGGPIHKKQAVDKAVGNQSMNTHTLRKALAELSLTFGTVKRIFPDLRTTRFRNLSEFYTLLLVIWEMHQQKLILRDKRRNRVAMRLLKQFSDGVDHVREKQRSTKGAGPNQRLYASYLLLTQQSTDAISQRRGRAEMVASLFSTLFARKDNQRTFSPEQRRLLWNSDERKQCSICGGVLDWTNFQIDHIKPHARGGTTRLRNAALACAPCNAAKGARTRKRRAS